MKKKSHWLLELYDAIYFRCIFLNVRLLYYICIQRLNIGLNIWNKKFNKNKIHKGSVLAVITKQCECFIFLHVSVCPTFGLLTPSVVEKTSGLKDGPGTNSNQMHTVRLESCIMPHIWQIHSLKYVLVFLKLNNDIFYLIRFRSWPWSVWIPLNYEEEVTCILISATAC